MAKTKILGGRWRIREKIGDGGQAETFLVVDEQFKSEALYALKRLKNPDRVRRFAREISTIQILCHKNLIRLIDAGLDAPKPYLVMEYCKGRSFRDGWKANVGTERTLTTFLEICDGLAAAHRAGVIHRDIKPENILFRQPGSEPVVADFGLCYVGEDERLTSTSEAVGPRHFMAPEFEDGRLGNVTASADVYSLGKLLYWMLTGQSFAREKHRDPDFDLIRVSLGDHRYLHVNRLLDKMIVADPSLRLKDAEDVGTQMRTVYRVWVGGYNAVSGSHPQRCTYCGLDDYEDGGRADNFGLRSSSTGVSDHKILICPSCGHCQIFRLDYAKKNWWAE